MTDVPPEEVAAEPVAEEAPAAEPEPVELPPLAPELQAQLDEIQAERAAREEAAAQDAAAEEARVGALVAAKAICEEQCGPIAARIAVSTDDDERAALVEFETRTHEGHRVALEEAYAAFSGQAPGESNPAEPGVTEITSTSESAADATA